MGQERCGVRELIRFARSGIGRFDAAGVGVGYQYYHFDAQALVPRVTGATTDLSAVRRLHRGWT